MMSDAKEIIASLNSASDWAFVLGAATVGFVLDGAINIVPIPFFSPGVCGMTAAASALSVKRTIEASIAQRKSSRRRAVLRQEAQRCLEDLTTANDREAADDLHWELQLNGTDIEKLEALVRDARGKTKQQSMATIGGVRFRTRPVFYGGGSETGER